MRPIFIAALAAIAAWMAGHGLARSAVDSGTGAAPAMELVVFEHPDCAYCPAFRNSIAPRYQALAAGSRSAAALRRHHRVRIRAATAC